MSDDRSAEANDESNEASSVHSAGLSLTAAPSTRRAALGITAAAAAVLADRAISPSSARATEEIVKSVNKKTGVVEGIAEVNTEGTEKGKLLGSQVPSSVVTDSRTPVYVESYRAIAANEAAMWAEAITAATNSGTTGGEVVGGGTGITYKFATGTVPLLPVNLPRAGLKIDMAHSTIQLSSAVPRPWDPARTADYQTLQNIEICNGTIDQNNVGGSHHVILGNYVAGVALKRMSFDRLYVHDMKVINAPVDPTLKTARLSAINLNLSTLANEETTQISATNCTFRRLDVEGAGVGVYVGGDASEVKEGSKPNAWIDNIEVSDLRHELPGVQTTAFASCQVQIGQCALVGSVRIEKVKGYNSGDVSIEVDNAANASIKDCQSTDARGYAFYCTNFRTAVNPSGGGTDWSVYAQIIKWTDCHAQRHSLINTAGANAFGRSFVVADSGQSQPIGTVKYTRCSMHRTAADTNTATLGEMFNLSGAVYRICITDCDCDIENIANASGTNSASPFATNFSTASVQPIVQIKGLHIRASGSIAGGTFSWYESQWNLGEAPNLDMLIDVDDFVVDTNIVASGGTIGHLIGMDFGRSGARVAGRVRGLKFPTFLNYSGRIGVALASTTSLTVRSLLVEDCDFTNVPAGNEITFSGSGETSNASKVIVGPTVRWANNNEKRSPSGRVTTAVSSTSGPFDTLTAVTNTGAAREITLPLAAAVPVGLIYELVDESNGAATHNITWACQGSDTFLGGATSQVISTNGGSLRAYSNGTTWVPA